MKTKTIEIRDSATFIPALAVRMGLDHEGDRYLMERAGFQVPETYILLIHLEGMRIEYDPYEWSDRTMQAAHLYIEKEFDRLKPGEVVDVEYILKEKEAPKLSERVTSRF